MNVNAQTAANPGGAGRTRCSGEEHYGCMHLLIRVNESGERAPRGAIRLNKYGTGSGYCVSEVNPVAQFGVNS